MPLVTPPPVMIRPSRTTRSCSGDGSDGVEQSVRRPVRRRTPTDKQASGPEHERSGAHARDVACVLGLPLDELDSEVVLQQVERAFPPGDHEHIGLWRVVERRGRHDGESRVSADWFPVAPGQIDGRTGQSGEELHRPGEVELCDVREQ